MNKHTSQHGIALLLVLVALVLSVSAAAGLARVAATARVRHETDAARQITRELLNASETPILDWLHRHAGSVVLPPDAQSPRLLVLDDAIDLRGLPCRITITAFDQCGMAPRSEAGGRLALFLPGDAQRVLARSGIARAKHPGLDVLVAANDGSSLVFPGHESQFAIGERLATHNPVRAGRPAALNVNTAPLELVAAVYAEHALGDIEPVRDARALGRIASPGASRAPRIHASTSSIVPGSQSTVWSFRIDCWAGDIRESWWCVYVDTGNNWERVQRLAITE